MKEMVCVKAMVFESKNNGNVPVLCFVPKDEFGTVRLELQRNNVYTPSSCGVFIYAPNHFAFSITVEEVIDQLSRAKRVGLTTWEKEHDEYKFVCSVPHIKGAIPQVALRHTMEVVKAYILISNQSTHRGKRER